jgi:3-isopropylmalate/(R)-2-methylmalate dehydratase large subunit
MGIRRDLLPAWVTGEVWLDVPASQRFTLTGALQPGVLSRDLLHHIIGEIDADGCVDQVMEFTGPAARSVSLDGRAALCGLAMFTGAVTAVFNPDALSLDFARRRARRAFTPVESDPDAEYAVDHECDLAAIEPQVVEPPSPRNSRPIAAMEGTPVTQGYIGSCASGRLEDIRAAAEVLEGRQVARGFKLYVVPTSNQIMAQAAAEGLLEIVLEAGGYVAGPSCDFCFGHAGALAPRDVCISTGTLNIPGRMGSFDARIYLGSAYTVAASAIEGRIADPRRYVRRTP